MNSFLNQWADFVSNPSQRYGFRRPVLIIHTSGGTILPSNSLPLSKKPANHGTILLI
jgi:hypothetical protein